MQIVIEILGMQDCLVEFNVNRAEPEFGISEHVDEFDIIEISGRIPSDASRRATHSHIRNAHGEYDRIVKLCEEAAGLYV